MLSVVNKPSMLSVVMLSVVMLSGTANINGHQNDNDCRLGEEPAKSPSLE
jgi:hypothetical protein